LPRSLQQSPLYGSNKRARALPYYVKRLYQNVLRTTTYESLDA
jgi:hypothetical protein